MLCKIFGPKADKTALVHTIKKQLLIYESTGRLVVVVEPYFTGKTCNTDLRKGFSMYNEFHGDVL